MVVELDDGSAGGLGEPSWYYCMNDAGAAGGD
jgi:hypothetical protein